MTRHVRRHSGRSPSAYDVTAWNRPPVSPTAKALRNLELLQSWPGITAAELAGRLEVSDRAVRRYVAILREAGVPVESCAAARRLPDRTIASASAAALHRHAKRSGWSWPCSTAITPPPTPTTPSARRSGKLIRCLPGHTGRQAACGPGARPGGTGPTCRPPRPQDHLRPRRGASPAARCAHLVHERSGTAVETRPTRGRSSSVTVAGTCRASPMRRQLPAPIGSTASAPSTSSTSTSTRRTISTPWPTSSTTSPAAGPTRPASSSTPRSTSSHRSSEPHGSARAHRRRPLRPAWHDQQPAMYAGEWLAAIPHRFRVVGGPELRRAVRKTGDRLVSAATTDVAATGTR